MIPGIIAITGMPGVSITFRQGRVVAIAGLDSSIPADGVVIHFGPGAKAQEQLKKFQVGDRVKWRLLWRQGSKTGPVLDWRQGAVGLGAGPLLVRNGKVVVNPQAEGITHWKQTQAAGPKSFVAMLPNRVVLLGNVNNAGCGAWWSLAGGSGQTGLRNRC